MAHKFNELCHHDNITWKHGSNLAGLTHDCSESGMLSRVEKINWLPQQVAHFSQSCVTISCIHKSAELWGQWHTDTYKPKSLFLISFHFHTHFIIARSSVFLLHVTYSLKQLCSNFFFDTYFFPITISWGPPSNFS